MQLKKYLREVFLEPYPLACFSKIGSIDVIREKGFLGFCVILLGWFVFLVCFALLAFPVVYLLGFLELLRQSLRKIVMQGLEKMGLRF